MTMEMHQPTALSSHPPLEGGSENSSEAQNFMGRGRGDGFNEIAIDQMTDAPQPLPKPLAAV
ncbi:hypothetical protein [Parvibaculum sp.]